MITMNGGISMFTHTAIKPFFYVCTDTSFPRQQPALFAQALQLSQRVALWQEQLDGLPSKPCGELFPLKKAPDLSLFESLFEHNPQLIRSRTFWNKRARSLGFSKDLSQGFSTHVLLPTWRCNWLTTLAFPRYFWWVST